MGNQQGRTFNEDDVPRKVAKWRAELEHVKELNKMLTEERKIVTTSMEQELYDKQVELFYLGKSATKHIGFRGYLKIINKVSPRTQADFMTPGDYDKDKKPATQSTAMVLRSAILNFSLFALFEAWLLKRMHFVSIQKHQRRLHQKGWKNIVAFYSEEIPSIQEIFEKQEPHLRERVEIGKKENMDMLEEYETKLFQQEEEIMRLRRQLEEMHGLGSERGNTDYETMRYGDYQQGDKPRMSLDSAFLGTTEAHREFNKARSPVQALIQNMQKTESRRHIDDGPVEKGWRTEPTRTWGASDEDSDNESLYTEEKNKKDGFVIGSDKHGWRKEPDPYEQDYVLKNKMRAFESKMNSAGLGVNDPSSDDAVSAISDNSGGNSISSAKKKALRDKEAIRLERERLEKAKADRKRRKEMERMERESFYKQERERLQHQEKRLNLKREESSRVRQGRFDDDASQEGFVDAVEEMEGSENQIEPNSGADDYDEDLQDKVRQRIGTKQESKRSIGSFVDENDQENTEEYEDDEDEEVIGLNDMDLGDGSKVRSPAFGPDRHPSMDTDALLIDDSRKRSGMDRRKVWQKDKADSDRDLGSGDDDSIGNEIKRMEEMETSIHRSESGGDVDMDELEVRSATRSRGTFGGSVRRSNNFDSSGRSNYKAEDTVPLDGSGRSKPVRSSVSKLRDRFEATGPTSSDERSVHSKSSRGSSARKKKKKGKVADGGEEVVVRKKKKKKKRPKQNEDDDTYYEDEDMTVTSALTSNSYE